MDIKLFQQKLNEICTIAEENGKQLSQQQIREHFDESDLSTSQLVKILQKLKLKAITIQVAEEAARTAEVYGNEVVRLYDVGVPGTHRLMNHIDTIMNARVIIAIAGMEGALASVIGGMADCPVIAVPTSVGYGANFGGLSALLSMLNSCASGVSVVNIDNGFGAGYLASMINHM